MPYSRRSRVTRRSSSSRPGAPTASDDRRAQHAAAVGSGEPVLELAGELGALVGLGARAVVAVALLGEDVVGVHEPAADHADRLLVGDVAGAEDRVDGELDGLERGEQQLGARPGKDGAVGERAEGQHGLPALADLGLHAQALRPAPGARHHGDARFEQPQDVVFERDEAALAVVLEQDRLRLEVLVGLRLAEAAAQAPGNEPLQRARGGAFAAQVVAQALEGVALRSQDVVELALAQAARVGEAEGALELAPPVAPLTAEHAGDARLQGARGVRDPHGEVGLGPRDRAALQARALLVDQRLPFGGVAVAAVDGGVGAGRVVLQRPLAADAQQLEVGFQAVGGVGQVAHQVDLAAPRAALVGVHLQRVDRPHLVGERPPHEVAVHEGDRLARHAGRRHGHCSRASNTSCSPGRSVTWVPTCSGRSEVCSTCRRRPRCHPRAG